MSPRYDIVVPSAGRPELARLLTALGEQDGPALERVIVVDDRGDAGGAPLELGAAAEELGERLELVRGAGRGPAAARNVGWRHARAAWVVFLDDDVVPLPDWSERLAEDLGALAPDVAASQGRIRVPLPSDRRPTDRERCVAGLERAVWATADMAYRRAVLAAFGGFDERFPRAYREDADLGLRVTRAGHPIARGARTVVHPVAPTGPLTSVRLQAGNADDVLMRALHGRGWREAAGAPAGRRRRHLATVAGAVVAGGAAVSGRRRLAATASLAWAAGTAELAGARIAPGPRTGRELATMLLTSALIPPAATFHTLAGLVTLPRKLRAPGPPPSAAAPSSAVAADGLGAAPAPDGRPHAVLLDRDGTLVVDVPYNGDPAAVEPMPGAAEALERLRAAGVHTAVVSNQSGIGRGLLSRDRVEAVNRRVEELLGPLGPWVVCPHAPGDGCDCRKPAPGLVLRAAELLGADPRRCAVIGDIGSDVEAARAAGARAILVPTPVTRREEIAAAPEVAPDLASAVDLLLGERVA
ncbi:MAG TPA: HAD-IIIA family hydrolase [Thermoleophilaceae bacterium]|nr:HAD-IIIA family hydrolase [Thermoleophilaceae bacterium]